MLVKSEYTKAIPEGVFMDTRLKPVHSHIYCVLSIRAMNKGKVKSLNMEDMAKECGISRKTFSDALKVLVETGWVILERGGKFGKNKETNTYTLNPNNTFEVDKDTKYGEYVQECIGEEEFIEEVDVFSFKVGGEHEIIKDRTVHRTVKKKLTAKEALKQPTVHGFPKQETEEVVEKTTEVVKVKHPTKQRESAIAPARPAQTAAPVSAHISSGYDIDNETTDQKVARIAQKTGIPAWKLRQTQRGEYNKADARRNIQLQEGGMISENEDGSYAVIGQKL